ncbi:MAG: type VI secretion system protein TssA, partial [Gammaproteobacteria bacterium]
ESEATSEEVSAKETVDAVVEQNTTDVPDWVGSTFDPFSTNPEGEDPRYSDGFVAIKQEIDKLADTDYQLVIDEAISILTNEAKDLRVAGYLILGLVYLEGAKGLIIGLQVYVQLLENYFESSFPQKINAKVTAISWLNNNKLLFYLENDESNFESYQLDEISELIIKLNSLVKDGFSEQSDITIPEITIVKPWLEKNKKILKDKKQKEQDVKKAKTASTSGVGTTGGGSASVGSIQSDSDVLKAINTLTKYLMSNEQYTKAIGISRSVNWSVAALPINDNGKTKLPAPRKTGLNTIKQLIAKGDHKSALNQSEAMMFEPGGNFLLDLQFLSFTAAKNMQREDVSKYIALQTSLLLQRLPGIESLKFNDDTPFVQPDAKIWLDEVSAMGGGGTSLQLELDEALDKTIEEARAIAESKNLQEGLAVFANYNAYSQKQRFKMKLQMAVMCMEANRPELALPVLDDLCDNAEQYSLAMWDSTLHILLLKHTQNAIRGMIATANDEDKISYETRLVSISNQICKTDIQQALSVL